MGIFHFRYRIVYIEEKVPDNFTIQELELFSHYLFHDLLELVDFNLHAAGDTNGCPQFHILPRFVRDLPDHGKEMLSMNQVLQYLIQQNVPVIDETELGYQLKLPQVIRFWIALVLCVHMFTLVDYKCSNFFLFFTVSSMIGRIWLILQKE
jgi:hypothetical protein